MDKEKRRQKRLALLEETILYYSENTLRRCVIKNDQCYYDGTRNMQTQSDGCAIGRLIPNETAKLLDTYNDEDYSIVSLYYLIPKKVQKYGKYFLSSLQELHDLNVNWDENGLTESGHRFVASIKNTYKLE